MTFSENLDEYFDTSDFAVAAVSGAVTVYGIFENAYSEDLASQGTLPIMTCKTSDADLFAINNLLSIEGHTYYLRIKKDDGTGVTTMVLERTITEV